MLEIQAELDDPKLWENPKQAKAWHMERVELESLIQADDFCAHQIEHLLDMLALMEQEEDSSLLDEIHPEMVALEQKISALEVARMFSDPMDTRHAYLDIQAGSGGTEAQDWAEMLLRMYLRWGDQHRFKTSLLEVSAGEVAGIKSATVEFQGNYAFGWLRTETGVHRLVRKSPFDAGNRRHTSFASVFVSPEIDDHIAISIQSSDLRIDTYRASGAGGQHVNRTDSAVRITHIPTGMVVQCQSDRSQHKNKAQAMKQLQSKLYELEMLKQKEQENLRESGKLEISWGRQIRSYILDDARVKDLRTGVETTNTTAVLNGDLDGFIEACLKQEL